MDIQRAIKYCRENPTDVYCMNYLTCSCLVDLVYVVETLSDDAREDYLKLEDFIVERIQSAGERIDAFASFDTEYPFLVITKSNLFL